MRSNSHAFVPGTHVSLSVLFPAVLSTSLPRILQHARIMVRPAVESLFKAVSLAVDLSDTVAGLKTQIMKREGMHLHHAHARCDQTSHSGSR